MIFPKPLKKHQSYFLVLLFLKNYGGQKGSKKLEEIFYSHLVLMQ